MQKSGGRRRSARRPDGAGNANFGQVTKAEKGPLVLCTSRRARRRRGLEDGDLEVLPARSVLDLARQLNKIVDSRHLSSRASKHVDSQLVTAMRASGNQSPMRTDVRGSSAVRCEGAHGHPARNDRRRSSAPPSTRAHRRRGRQTRSAAADRGTDLGKWWRTMSCRSRKDTKYAS